MRERACEIKRERETHTMREIQRERDKRTDRQTEEDTSGNKERAREREEGEVQRKETRERK